MYKIEAIQDISNVSKKDSLFIAGGITGCADWQSEMINMLKHSRLTILNPRRKDFPIHDPNASFEQIKWEHEALRKAGFISFWFPEETICPIVLYELGAWSMTKKPIFVGVHPNYQRRQDVEIQTKLVRSDVGVVYSLEDLVSEITNNKKIKKQQGKADNINDGAF